MSFSKTCWSAVAVVDGCEDGVAVALALLLMIAYELKNIGGEIKSERKVSEERLRSFKKLGKSYGLCLALRPGLHAQIWPPRRPL